MVMLYRLSIIIRFLFILSISVLLLACSQNSDVNEPVELVWDKKGIRTDELIVFLPGLYDKAEIFKEEQFFTMARNAGIKADMVAASIHIDHLLQERVTERIEKDVFKNAIKSRYKNIWFVGVSLGGLNSLLFYKKHAKDICGVVALAPYLAGKVLTKELQKAGGIKNWSPVYIDNSKEVDDNEIMYRNLQKLWIWFKDQDRKNNLKQIFIGYGDEDRYIDTQKLFSVLLPVNNITVIAGKHKWKTGRKLWLKQLSMQAETGLLKPCR